MDFHDTWWWLNNHPINMRPTGTGKEYSAGLYQLDIFVAKVNPETENIEDNESLNTETRVWLEFGPFPKTEDYEALFYDRMHDPRLDCGGETFEGAILNLANLVRQYYGDY